MAFDSFGGGVDEGQTIFCIMFQSYNITDSIVRVLQPNNGMSTVFLLHNVFFPSRTKDPYHLTSILVHCALFMHEGRQTLKVH